MRIYCESAPQYSCHVSPAIRAAFGSSLPDLKANVKKRGVGVKRTFRFPLILPVKCALSFLQALQKLTCKQVYLSIQHGCLASAVHVWGAGSHEVCASYCYGLIPLSPQVTMCIHSVLLLPLQMMFLWSAKFVLHTSVYTHIIVFYLTLGQFRS